MGKMPDNLWNILHLIGLRKGLTEVELAHGLSTRLTGGPQNSGCLGWGESSGMSKGWGDFIGTSVHSTSTSTSTSYAMGAWASNREGGIRYWGVHVIGKVWAEMLWVVQQHLIATYGFSETLLPPTPNTDGSLPPNDFY
ncbi:hypothetical protein PAXINDRAFT_15564 [Paxillus involutus ATCC 200175]|uniref:Extracellular metalloproteinase n=1 Tax=Paxillus involutus ATCC 200175 TaxID=664439 RepID=A0A0C9TW96_PAXIN|nr:hypothetical protein PAXINDRAFT_15564 [Paxillus involutus ATCC 200175]